MENLKEFLSFTVVWVIVFCVLVLAGAKLVSGLAQGMQQQISKATIRLR